MGLQHVVVAAFVLYAAFYLSRYVWRMLKGKKVGCGCGASVCPKDRPGDSEQP